MFARRHDPPPSCASAPPQDAKPLTSDSYQILADAMLLADHGRPASALDLATTTFDQALACGDQSVRAAAAAQLAWFCLMLSQPEEGLAFARLASRIAGSLGHVEVEARARSTAAWLMVELGEADAIAEARTALAAAERSGSPVVIGFARNALGVCFYALQQPDLAVRECTIAADGARAIGDAVGEGRYLTNVAIAIADIVEVETDAARRVDRYREAADLTRRGLILSETAGDSWGARINLCNLAEFTILLGRPSDARSLLARHGSLDGELGDRDYAHLDHTLSLCLAAEALWPDAEAALTRCIERCRRAEFLQLHILAERDLAALLARLLRFEEAYLAHRRFHALYVSRSADGAQRRARALAIQHDMEQLAAGFEAERTRADALAATNEALAAETARLLRTSLEDPLTGLPNRRALDQSLARIGAEPFALAMIDIDGFKRINDEFSHGVGDLVLRELGGLVREVFAPPAFAARYGGEEFTALLPHGDEALAMDACEALRGAVEGFAWGKLQCGLEVTISIGVAVAPEGRPAADMLRLADKRLYLAKRLGRNRVEAGLVPLTAHQRSARLRLASGI
jgi:diguanylate cyclase (GGDEF)-like protein